MPKATKNQQAVQDYRKLSVADLAKQLDKSRSQLQQLRSELAIGKLTNHQAIKHARLSIAQMETVKREKIILEEVNNDDNQA